MTKKQVIDEEHEATRPLYCILKCHGCSTTFEYRWKYCTRCHYAEATITNCKPYGKIIQDDPKGCRGKHKLYAAPGPFPECLVCGSVYATWVNFVPRKYKWVDAASGE